METVPDEDDTEKLVLPTRIHPIQALLNAKPVF